LRWIHRTVRIAVTLILAAAVGFSMEAQGAGPLVRVELKLAPDARTSPHPLLLTLGGPVYCMQLENLARNIGASLACTDYGPNRYEGVGGRAGRREDWGDPSYLAQVATLPNRLRAEGVKVSKLIVVGVSYSGYANAELVATHPEIHPAALIVVDSYLDLPARYAALPPSHETRVEIEAVLGGTLDQKRAAYEARSPSHHLAGLAAAVRSGMKLVVVWSTSPGEEREFRGATCSRQANAQWLSALAGILHEPVTGYVTQLPHAHAFWDRGQALLALAGIGHADKPLLARTFTFKPGGNPPRSSYCPTP
jgi:pimeloyl-ACP methyl ester carboxylesterase